ncbi:MAG: sodium:calcium antiporter [Desulfovibrio sp.]|nr:sodium:calcium antiporter [Desulfovibrio sp.]
MPRAFRPFFWAILLTIPGLLLRFFPGQASPILLATFAGLAILGSSFLLTWACEAGQLDMPQAVAIAVVAFIAVLPEYAVDMYFTWMAGQEPLSTYSHFAIANMTGANRLLIGLGWSVLVLIFASRFHKGIRLRGEKRTEIFFLGLATLYALIIPLKGSLTWIDGVILLAIYVWYLLIIARRGLDDEPIEGPAAALAKLKPGQRKLCVFFLFLFSAAVIVLDAEPFSENLVKSGKLLGVNEFLLVQWIAPIASEAPEFIISIMFAMRGNAGLALGSLLASKLNQWTLLVGMIPWVYALSSQGFTPPMNLDSHQFQEILLTAAQSFFAVALLMNLHLHKLQAVWLLLLFMGQFLAPLYEELVAQCLGLQPDPLRFHRLFSWAYLFFGICTVLRDRKYLLLLLRGFKG